MRTRLKFGMVVLAVAACAAGPVTCLRRRPIPIVRRKAILRPRLLPRIRKIRITNADRPPANPNHPPANQNNRAPQSHVAPQANYSKAYRPNGGANLNQRQQLGVGAARPWVDTMRELSPAQRERVLQNSRAFQNLSPDKQNKIRQQFNQWDHMTPQQRQDLRSKEAIWTHLTPEQRDHIKNDVLPKWRQMPWDRQQVLKQKLGVLQNMPESARNQRLDDPNFTRGMSDDEKSMLRDLSHTHIGAPDSPNE